MISLPYYVEISPTELDIFKIQTFDPHFIQYFVKSYTFGKRLSILSELYVFVLTVTGGKSARKNGFQPGTLLLHYGNIFIFK